MEREINQLAEKIDQLIQLTHHLADANQALQFSLTQTQQQNSELRNKIEQASQRVEQLIADLPEASS